MVGAMTLDRPRINRQTNHHQTTADSAATADYLKLNCADVLKLIRPNGTIETMTTVADGEKQGKDVGDTDDKMQTTQYRLSNWINGKGSALPPLSSTSLSPAQSRKSGGNWSKQITGKREPVMISPNRNSKTSAIVPTKDFVTKGGGYRLSRPLSPLENKTSLAQAQTKSQDVATGASGGMAREDTLMTASFIGRPSRRYDPPSYQSKLFHYMNKKKELTKQIHLRSSHVDFHARPEQRPKLLYSHTALNHGKTVGGRGPAVFKEKIDEFKKWHERENTNKNIRKVSKTSAKTGDVPAGLNSQTRVDKSRKHSNTETRETEDRISYDRKYIVSDSEVNNNNNNGSHFRVGRPVPGSSKKFGNIEGNVTNITHEEIGLSQTSSGSDTIKNTSDRENPPPESTAKPNETLGADGNAALVNKRPFSVETWHTWRNKHDSYAYNNVTEYIEDNELMPKKKKERIKNWIDQVDLHMYDIRMQDENDALSKFT